MRQPLVSKSRDAHTSHELSSKLSRGEIRDFAGAMQAVIDGMRAEHNESVRWNATLGPDEGALAWDTKHFDSFGEVAREALKVYSNAVKAAETRVIEQLRLQAKLRNTPEFDMIADALESGEYSSLAW